MIMPKNTEEKTRQDLDKHNETFDSNMTICQRKQKTNYQSIIIFLMFSYYMTCQLCKHFIYLFFPHSN